MLLAKFYPVYSSPKGEGTKLTKEASLSGWRRGKGAQLINCSLLSFLPHFDIFFLFFFLALTILH